MGSGCLVRSERSFPGATFCRTLLWKSLWPTEVSENSIKKFWAKKWNLLILISYFLLLIASVMFNFPDQATVKNVVHSLPRVGVGTSYGLPQARWVNVLTNQQETDNTYKSTFTLPSAIHVQAATFDERSTLYAQTCFSFKMGAFKRVPFTCHYLPFLQPFSGSTYKRRGCWTSVES